MRRINRCLNKQLINLCQQSIQLDDLNSIITRYLPPALHGHCAVSSFNKGCLILVTDKAIWATELRYCLPSLRDSLRKEAGLYQLRSIQVSISLDNKEEQSPQTKKSCRPSLSDLACDALTKAGDSCTYQPLREALLNLGKR